MTDEIEQHIAEVAEFYEPIIKGPTSRLVEGRKLWSQFEAAVSAFRTQGLKGFSAVIERINEMAVAHLILSDPTLTNATVTYEPDIADEGSRIDFVADLTCGRTIYLEVKTVHPRSNDNLGNWQKYLARRQHHSDGTDYIVNRDFLGAEIYTDSFSSRSKFLTYTEQFEARLEQACKILPGDGILIFCGTGAKWHESELEDFVDFYHSGTHRPDDPFGAMEADHISNKGIHLKRNIMAFAFVKRPMDELIASNLTCNVRGPR